MDYQVKSLIMEEIASFLTYLDALIEDNFSNMPQDLLDLKKKNIRDGVEIWLKLKGVKEAD